MTILLENSIFISGNECKATGALKNFIAPTNASIIEGLKRAGFKFILDVGTQHSLKKQESYYSDKLFASIFTDIFGFVKANAIENNLVFFTPSYGAISKLGVVNKADTLESLGIVSGSLEGVKRVVKEICLEDISWLDKISTARLLQNSDIFNHTETVLDILFCAEFSANTQKYDGIAKPFRTEEKHKTVKGLTTQTRAEGFSFLEKEKIIKGNFILSGENYNKIYHKAMKLRRKILNELLSQLSKNKIIKVERPTKNLLLLPSLCGIASLVIGGSMYLSIGGQK